jgi:hypothetical protein
MRSPRSPSRIRRRALPPPARPHADVGPGPHVSPRSRTAAHTDRGAYPYRHVRAHRERDTSLPA